MNVFDAVDEKVKQKIVQIWKGMKEPDKNYFIDQVSLVLSIFGVEEKGKGIVVSALEKLIADDSTNLSDFGLYINSLLQESPKEMAEKIKRAGTIVEDYRIKHALSSEPSKDIGI